MSSCHIMSYHVISKIRWCFHIFSYSFHICYVVDFSWFQEATTKFVVGIIALLAGNLIAKGQVAELLSFVVFFVAVGVLQWPLAAKSAAGLLVCSFLSSLHDGVSLEWAVPWNDVGMLRSSWDLGMLGWGQVPAGSHFIPASETCSHCTMNMNR